MHKAIQTIDPSRIGKKGFPIHYEALGLAPPMKWVPVDDDGVPDISHPGLTGEELAGYTNTDGQ